MRQFGHDESLHHLEAFGAQECPPAGGEQPQLLGRAGIFGFREPRFRRVERGDVRGVNHRAEKRFLVGEVQVDGALGDLGALGDVIEARIGESMLPELDERRVENLGWTRLRIAAPPGADGFDHERALDRNGKPFSCPRWVSANPVGYLSPRPSIRSNPTCAVHSAPTSNSGD